jgi:hypothetical protein
VERDERDERGLVDPWERRNTSHEGVEETRERGTRVIVEHVTTMDRGKVKRGLVEHGHVKN